MPIGSEQAFEAVSAAAREAAESCPVERCRLRVAGRAVDCAVAGPLLAAALDRPVRHLRDPEPSASIQLTVELFSCEETGVRPETPAPHDVDQVHGRAPDAVRTASGGGRYFRYEREGACLWLDQVAGRVAGWFESAAALNVYERGRPLHPVLLPWLAPESAWILHAGLVAAPAGGVLLPGAGGSGKTTATVACALAGMGWAADDVAIVERLNDRWRGWGAYSTAKLDRSRFDLVPAAARAAEPPELAEGPKALVYLDELPGLQATAGAPIAAIAFPVVGAGRPRAEPIGPAEALRQLIDGTVSVTAPGERPGLFEALGTLAEQVPAYQLHLGPSLEGVPELVAKLARAGLAR